MAADQISTEDIAKLRDAFSGQLILPSEPGYHDVRQVHNGMIDRRPALIARCLGAADVVDALTFALAQGLEVAVRGGGHNVAGRAVCEGIGDAPEGRCELFVGKTRDEEGVAMDRHIGDRVGAQGDLLLPHMHLLRVDGIG